MTRFVLLVDRRHVGMPHHRLPEHNRPTREAAAEEGRQLLLPGWASSERHCEACFCPADRTLTGLHFMWFPQLVSHNNMHNANIKVRHNKKIDVLPVAMVIFRHGISALE